MNDANYTPRNVTFDDETAAIVEQLVNDRKFGGKGFSLGVRTIIREWAEHRKLQASIDRQYEHFRTNLMKVQEFEFPHGNDQVAPEPVGLGTEVE